ICEWRSAQPERFWKRVGDFPLGGRNITMADRYQDRSFSDGGDYRDHRSQEAAKAESDPLAELARLIGQTDPFGTGRMSRANWPLQPHARAQARPTYEQDYEPSPQPDDELPPSPPSWMQRLARQEAPPPEPEDYPSAVHPVHRYAATQPPVQSDYDPEPSYADEGHEYAGEDHEYAGEDHEAAPDASRYDEALYGAYD